MGAELAVRDGIGSVVLDIRRGIGPEEGFHYTMPAIATTDGLIAEAPDVAAKVIRAISKDASGAEERCHACGRGRRKLFPAREAALIAGWSSATCPITNRRFRKLGRAMNQFSRDIGLLKGDPAYEDIVAAPNVLQILRHIDNHSASSS